MNGKKSLFLWGFTALIVISALVWLIYYLVYGQFHEYTNDAYANGNLVYINAPVPGSVIAFYADDTDYVTEGQLLVQLDPTKYQMDLEKELASLGEVVLHVRQLYDTLNVNATQVQNKRTAHQKALYDYENREQLVDSKAVSDQDYIHAKFSHLITELELKQAQQQLRVALDAVGDADPPNHPLIEKQKAIVRTAYYNLTHCSIYAPATGYIAQRSVDVGQWATPITNLMAVVPKDYFWVDANFKETQLTYMRIGQPARVHFDLYGSDVTFEGKVIGIASGTGSVFSIIPPQNATGNWIKIVQRLPVRISLDPEMLKKYPMRLGISAEVTTNISNQELPRLAQVSPTKPVATTGVFDINMEKIDSMINTIIRDHFQ